MSVKGRGAKRKGSRAEIKVRNILRTIYPTELRDKVQRVPLSGGGSIKGDVYDANDWDSCYEVKCQETLVLHDWWRQAKIQAGTSRTPVLVITQSYRPFYFILRKTDWDGMREMTEYDLFGEEIPMKKIKTLMDDLADLERYKVGSMTLDDDEVILIPQDFYVSVKESLYWLGKVDGSNSKSYNKDR